MLRERSPWTRRPHPPSHRPPVYSGSRGQSRVCVRVELGSGLLPRAGTASPSSPFRRGHPEDRAHGGHASSPDCARASPGSSGTHLRSLPLDPSPSPRAHPAARAAWTLGAPEIDRSLAGGLDAAALHEVKGEGCGTAAADWMAALGFALRLALRRLDALASRSGGAPAQILWCWPSVLARELGRPYGQGLAGLGSCAVLLSFRRDAARQRRALGHGGGLEIAEPGARHRCRARGGADAGAPLEPRRRRGLDAVPPHHRSACSPPRRPPRPAGASARARAQRTPSRRAPPARAATPSRSSAAARARARGRLRRFYWNGPMRRIVSVWLPAWPIERMRRAAPASVPDDAAARAGRDRAATASASPPSTRARRQRACAWARRSRMRAPRCRLFCRALPSRAATAWRFCGWRAGAGAMVRVATPTVRTVCGSR